MTTESDHERDVALAYMDVLLGTPKVMVHFERGMGWGRVPAKTIDFESAKPDKKERCIELLMYQKRCCEILLEEITNREDEKPKAATVDDPEQTDIQEILDSHPEQAVIIWHPDTKTQQKEVVAVTEIDDHVYLVRHLEDGSSETLFQGASWADLGHQVLAKSHRLEPMAPVAETVGPEPAASEPAEPQPPADVAATGPAAAVN